MRRARIATDSPIIALSLREFGGKRGVDLFEFVLAQSVANGEHGLLDREGFFDEVERAEFGGAHGGFDVAVTGNHHDRRLRAALAQACEGLKAVDAGQPHVEQHAAVSPSLDGLEALLARRHGFRREPFIFEHRPQRLADAALVVNNQNRVRHKHQSWKPDVRRE